MTLPDLPTQLRLTRRVTVSPTAARQFLALRHVQDHIPSGVLFGRWLAAPGLLSLEAATAEGDLTWQHTPDDHPLSVQPTGTEGAHDTRDAQPDVQVRPVGAWVVLPPVPILQAYRPVLNAILTRGYDQDFLQLAQHEHWLAGPQVVVIVREYAGHTNGQAYVFDPERDHRPLELDRRTAWPAAVSPAIPPTPVWLPDDRGQYWPAWPTQEGGEASAGPTAD